LADESNVLVASKANFSTIYSRTADITKEWVSRIINPAMADILDLREVNETACILMGAEHSCAAQGLAKQVEEIRHGHDLAYEKSGHRTIFHDLFESRMPSSEMKRDRLRDESIQSNYCGVRNIVSEPPD
jgi:hypothetical protein